MSGGPILLSDAAVPKRYDLTLEPNFDSFCFFGIVSIELQINRSSKVTELHSRELTIGSVVFRDKQGRMEPVKIEHNDTVLYIHWPRNTVVGSAMLAIDFIGKHNDSMAGFYRSKYRDTDGKMHWMVSTQFESLDARRCFPCWDEPARKATFDCTLIVPRVMTALSNQPIISEELTQNDRKRVTFDTTPVMSTYLLCFIVGQFSFIEQRSRSGVRIRCYTPLGRAKECRFALDTAVKSLELYEDFFDIPYPLKKIDHVAIPEFAAGAMENWGLVTYRSSDFLLPKSSTVAQQQRVFAVVVHETAHQWFGNLVTMKWWDDLWLNEGFACWMESYAAFRLQKHWKPWDSFIINVQARAQALDALHSSHPVQVPIRAAEEVEQVFDAISYCKGACVVYMVYDLLGEKKFQEGLRVYMKRHQYGNTVTMDLWRAWEEVSGEPITQLMNCWTMTQGFPLLRVTRHNKQIKIAQHHFLADGSSSDDRQWIVPIITLDVTGHRKHQRLEHAEQTYNIGHDDWCCVNANQATMARVQYPEDQYEALVKAVDHLSVRDRIGIVSDAYACCRAGFISVTALMTTLSIARTERDSWVWTTLAEPFGNMYRLLRCSDTEKASSFQEIVLPWIDAARPKEIWDVTQSDALETNRRRIILSLYQLFARDPTFVKQANHHFDRMVQSNEPIPMEIRTAVFRTVMQNNPEKYESLVSLLDVASSDAERKQIYRALGWVSKVELKRKTLDWAFNNVKTQDLHTPMFGVSESNANGASTAFSWLQENFTRVMERYAKTSPALLAALIRACCTGSCSTEALEATKCFVDQHMELRKRCGPKLKQMLEGMQNQHRFLTHLLQHN